MKLPYTRRGIPQRLFSEKPWPRSSTIHPKITVHNHPKIRECLTGTSPFLKTVAGEQQDQFDHEPNNASIVSDIELIEGPPRHLVDRPKGFEHEIRPRRIQEQPERNEEYIESQQAHQLFGERRRRRRLRDDPASGHVPRRVAVRFRNLFADQRLGGGAQIRAEDDQ